MCFAKQKDCLHFKVHSLEVAHDRMVLVNATCMQFVFQQDIVHSTVITVGYVQTDVSVSESDGVAQLTVAISVPPQGDPIETSFTLLVNTFNGTAAGLASCLNFDYIFIHTSLPLSH